jgi:plastocyanin
MKRLLSTVALVAATGPFFAVAGCEGEPPVMAPENPGPNAAAAASASVATQASDQDTSSAAATACPPPPCAPVTSAPVVVASGSAAPEASSAAALPVPPVSIARGNVVGTVTTKPAAMTQWAVVYLEDAPKEDAPAHMQSVTIDNRQMNFIPFVGVAAVGAKVVFVNSDPFPHNIFSPDGEKFNLGNLPQNGSHQRIFQHAGPYSLLCNLHPGMLGYLLVTPTTYFARVDAKGKYTMKHVPAGSYRVSAWAPRQGIVTQSVTVTEADVTANFDLHR